MCRHRNNKRKFTWDGHAPCSYARDEDDPPDAVADESMSPEGGDDDSDTKELTSPSAAVLDDEASDTRGLSMEPRGFPEVCTCRACPCRGGGASTQHASLSRRHRQGDTDVRLSLPSSQLEGLLLAPTSQLEGLLLAPAFGHNQAGEACWLPWLVYRPLQQASA